MDEEEEEEVQTKALSGNTGPLLLRQVDEEEEEETVQAKAHLSRTDNRTLDLKSGINFLKGGGEPLPKSIRTFYEPRFGYDFRKVRVHTDSKATDSARAFNARAFTVGGNIVFGEGQYAPETDRGRRLLAHELTHVVQQSNNSVQRKRVIQRWGVSAHESLTESAVNKTMSFFTGLEIDKSALDTLKKYSTEMDTRFPAICFNLPAVLIGSHENLARHYLSHKTEAQNHGEGGLYSLDPAAAKAANLEKQNQYENSARAAWTLTQRRFNTMDECFRTKSSGRESALGALGYALHVAQDRGSHGEGAIGQGHDRKDFSPDDPSVNDEGWKRAERNTEIVILQASDMLYKLLDRKWSRTCSVTRPAEVRVSYK
jgi:hypothetical protein